MDQKTLNEYADLLSQMQKSVRALKKIGTPEALQAISEDTLRNIEEIKTIINEHDPKKKKVEGTTNGNV